MSDPTLQSQVQAARAYESLFVPALMGQFAPRLVAAAGVRPGDRVLDVACGTGVVARAARSRAGVRGTVTGLDANPGMLTVARELDAAIEWREGRAESLPFADRSFDVVLSQFGLMFFADRQQALQEMLRVVTGGGRVAVAVWDAVGSMPAYAAEIDLIERLAGSQAADALLAPFALGVRRELAELFTGAGATSVTVTTEKGTARFPCVRVMVEADLRGWLPVMGVTLTEEQIARILREAERTLARYAEPGGTTAFELSAHMVVAARS
jgi:SAM-dependent methyltransferase